MKSVLLALVFILPASAVKNFLLRLLGCRIHESAVVKPVLVWHCSSVRVAEGAVIAGMSVFHNLSRLEMAADSYIGRWNFFSANPSFSRILPEAGKFSLARGAYVTNRHEIDCSGGVFLGEFSCVAGSGSLIQTHAINFDLDAQTGASVSIGEFSFVGSRCVLLMGASVAPQSVVGAKSLVLKDNAEGVPGLYAGVPVKYIRAIDGKWFSRTSAHTRSIANLASREVFPEAF